MSYGIIGESRRKCDLQRCLYRLHTDVTSGDLKVNEVASPDASSIDWFAAVFVEIRTPIAGNCDKLMLRDLSQEPGSSVNPKSIRGGCGDTEKLRGFTNSEAAEIAQLDKFRFLGLLRRQFVEGFA